MCSQSNRLIAGFWEARNPAAFIARPPQWPRSPYRVARTLQLDISRSFPLFGRALEGLYIGLAAFRRNIQSNLLCCRVDSDR